MGCRVALLAPLVFIFPGRQEAPRATHGIPFSARRRAFLAPPRDFFLLAFWCLCFLEQTLHVLRSGIAKRSIVSPYDVPTKALWPIALLSAPLFTITTMMNPISSVRHSLSPGGVASPTPPFSFLPAAGTETVRSLNTSL